MARIIANDIGTTSIKSLARFTSGTGATSKFEMPSIVGEFHESVGDAQEPPDSIQTEDGKWFVGDDAVSLSQNQVWGRDPAWVFSPQYKALQLFAIAKHASQSAREMHVNLVSALPFSDRGNCIALQERMAGDHVIHLGDRRIKITVAEAFFSIQGVAALMDNPPNGSDIVAWLGIGGRNITYATVDRGRIVPVRTGSTEGGMLTAIGQLSRQVQDDTYIEMSESEVIAVLDAGGLLRAGGTTLDIRKMAQKSFAAYSDAVNSRIGEVWPADYMARLTQLRIGGGGALGIFDQIKARFPQAEMSPDPRWTEARGLLAVGRARWQK